MTIREAEEKDAKELSSLLNQLGYPTSAEESIKRIERYREKGYKLLVGEEDSRVIGFIALHWYNAIHHPRPIGRVIGFCMDEKIRSKGFGTALLEYAEKFLIGKNCFKAEVTSNVRRKETHEYYLRRGYQQTNMHFIKFLEATR